MGHCQLWLDGSKKTFSFVWEHQTFITTIFSPARVFEPSFSWVVTMNFTSVTGFEGLLELNQSFFCFKSFFLKIELLQIRTLAVIIIGFLLNYLADGWIWGEGKMWQMNRRFWFLIHFRENLFSDVIQLRPCPKVVRFKSLFFFPLINRLI